jgi:hypothetical protein
VVHADTLPQSGTEAIHVLFYKIKKVNYGPKEFSVFQQARYTGISIKDLDETFVFKLNNELKI